MAKKTKPPTEGGQTVHLKPVPSREKPADAPVGKVLAVPKAAIVKPNVIQTAIIEATPQKAPMIKKNDFIDRVVATSGRKKGDVKAIVDATLLELRDALLVGEDLQLLPLGKVKVQNCKDVGNATKALTLKVRTPTDVTES